MYKFLTKHGQSLAFGLGVLLTLIFLGSVYGGLEEFTQLEIADKKDNTRERMGTTIFNFGLYISAIMTVVAGAVWLLFGLFQTATNFKSSLKFIIGLVVLIAVFFAAYSSADPTVKDIWASDFGITPTISKFVGGALVTTFGLCILTAAVFILGELRNFFK